MPVLNRIADLAGEMSVWRRHIHRNPELGLDCFQTAAFVAERLRAFGVDEVHEGIARSGIVAIINGQGEGATIGLRTDMDALPITEATGLPYASAVPGVMHACGHDGHTAMLLGAAQYLAETRRFAGRVALIFQPAEENEGGGRIMCEEGVMERFAIREVYGLHNAPGQAFGSFATRPGPLMAAVDTFDITIRGQGGHGARPHETRDPVAAAVQIAQAFQTIVSRNAYAGDRLVVSLTQIHAGSADNIIPGEAWMNGTIRTFRKEVQAMVRQRMEAICRGIAEAMAVEVDFAYVYGYPATVNDEGRTAFAADVAREVAGAAGVDPAIDPEMWAEDFAYMLEARPGSYLFLGQGPGAGLHTPDYNFNDEIAPVGASFLARLAERALPLA